MKPYHDLDFCTGRLQAGQQYVLDRTLIYKSMGPGFKSALSNIRVSLQLDRVHEGVDILA